MYSYKGQTKCTEDDSKNILQALWHYTVQQKQNFILANLIKNMIHTVLIEAVDIAQTDDVYTLTVTMKGS